MARPGLTLVERLGYLFAPPDRSHDGSRMDTAALRAADRAGRPGADDAPGVAALSFAGSPQGS